jgi:hypothetical protein
MMHILGLVLLSIGLLHLLEQYDPLPWPFYLGLCFLGLGLIMFHHSRVNSK